MALPFEPVTAAQLLLFGILFGAFFVGTMMGFGTTLLTVTFGALFMPIDDILPVIAPLNLALSLYLAVRHRRQIQWRPLLRRVLPAVSLGVPVGLLLFVFREAVVLRLALGLFVTVIAAGEVWRAWANDTGGTTIPLPRWASWAVLALGGVVHGLFNTGGPLIVYALGRELDDKGAFRSTVAALFVVVTAVLVVDYVVIGLVTPTTLTVTGVATLPVLLGMVLGELAHNRIPPLAFKRALWALLLVGGVVLTLRVILSG